MLILFSIEYFIKYQSKFINYILGVFITLPIYYYTGAKITLIIGFLYLVFKKRYLSYKQIAIILLMMFLTALPLILYLQNTENNYLVRENEVSILSNIESFPYLYDGANIFNIFLNHFFINIRSMFDIRDNSNQYGNTYLFDIITTILFFIGNIITLAHLFIKKFRRNFELEFLIIVFYFLISIISLTESPPLSTRLLILYPIVSIISANTLYLFHIRFQKYSYIVILIILFSILSINTYYYFYRYPQENLAYYNWIEPNASIGKFILNSNYNKYAIYATPHSYPTHSITKLFLYKHNKQVDTIDVPDDIRTMLENGYIIILPIDNTDKSIDVIDYYQNSIELIQYNSQSIYGIPCKSCTNEEILILIFPR